jgi:hypothetical protein
MSDNFLLGRSRKLSFSSELACSMKLSYALKKEVHLNESWCSNIGVAKLQGLWYTTPEMIFLFSDVSRLALGLTQTLIQWVPEIPSLGCKAAVEWN